MLYCDEVASTEEEAILNATRKMRLSRQDVVVRSVTEVDGGVRVRIEAVRSRGQEASELVEDILRRIGIESEIFYIESFDRILINIKGPHLGLIIGKGGTTLEALETVVNVMHNRDHTMFKPVVINPGGYRENKRKALRTLVQRACEAARNGDKVCLPVTKQRDRKQIHQIIKEFPGFRSRSFGEGDDRKVYIFLATDEDAEAVKEEDETGFMPPGACRTELKDDRLSASP